MIKLLFIGDIVGKPGREVVKQLLPSIISKEKVDFVVANGENLANGAGITRKTVMEMKAYGVDVLTGGNHTFDKKEGVDLLKESDFVLRPLNYPPGTPGRGWNLFNVNDVKIAVISLIGRLFMGNFDCPFRAMKGALELVKDADLTIVDFHAEATSEKLSFLYEFEGKVTAILGTHTHVQTNDARIVNGVGYITDAGMTGGLGGVIGVKRELFVRRMITQLPVRFEPELRNPGLCGVLITADAASGKAINIEAVRQYL